MKIYPSSFIQKIIESIFLFGLFMFLFTLLSCHSTEKQTAFIQANHHAKQLMVEGKPWLMLAGELHNSSSSSVEYFESAVQNAKAMNINTLIASVAWEQLEPAPDVFDYKLIDALIAGTEKNNLKLVIIWFGSWKNGESSYTPIWVKEDTVKYFRVKDKSGKSMTAISPFCMEAKMADARAFSMLMKRIKEIDRNKTVVMVQVENEAGAFTDIDHQATALDLFSQPVPEKLIHYLLAHKNNLQPELKEAWESHGLKTSGTWSEIFGKEKLNAQNFFMSWHYALYMDKAAGQGKQAYNLPVFVNAWLVQHPGEMPGAYPNGGPVSRVMDIYHIASSNIDFLAPDIYLPNYKEVLRMYHIPNKNPLFIPECERTHPGKAYYALAEHDALGFGPFGIESLINDAGYVQSFLVLKELLPVMAAWQGTRKMRGFLREEGEDSVTFTFDKYKVFVQYNKNEKFCYGLIIKIAESEFLVAGINAKITFSKNNRNCIGQVWEGEFADENWKEGRLLNGDETWHNSALFCTGRSYLATMENKQRIFKRVLSPIPVLKQSLEKYLEQEFIKAPGVYKVIMLK